MQIQYHKQFLKNYRKRIASNKKLDVKFIAQLNKLLTNPSDVTLKNHSLSGKLKNFWSFSVTGDVRVVYQIVEDSILLYDIGTHNQVY